MSKTQENLRSAFAGESQANRKYLAFAKVAEKEGKMNLAKLFRAVAEGETIHALKHFDVLGEIGGSAENLKAAIAGETYEIEKMYPAFISDAVEEENALAEMSFDKANEVEKRHQEIYSQALEKVEAGGDIEEKKYFVCGVCGYLTENEAPDNCPVCNAPKEKFSEVV